MPFVELNHNCGKPGCEGLPGDVIEVSAEDLAYLLERKGGKEVPAPPKPEAPVMEKAESTKPAKAEKR